MTRDEILDKVTGIFRDVFGDDSIIITDATTAADIGGWDSLSHITLINEVEEAFGMKFSMKDTMSMNNVGDMLDILAR